MYCTTSFNNPYLARIIIDQSNDPNIQNNEENEDIDNQT